MPQYRKKPILIEAEQWFPGKEIEGVVMQRNLEAEQRFGEPVGKLYPTIKTLEGAMTVSEGDWIITGVKGEKYPCKPDIFAATYEAVLEKDALPDSSPAYGSPEWLEAYEDMGGA